MRRGDDTKCPSLEIMLSSETSWHFLLKVLLTAQCSDVYHGCAGRLVQHILMVVIL
jgi:hypothetical protein